MHPHCTAKDKEKWFNLKIASSPLPEEVKKNKIITLYVQCFRSIALLSYEGSRACRGVMIEKKLLFLSKTPPPPPPCLSISFEGYWGRKFLTWCTNSFSQQPNVVVMQQPTGYPMVIQQTTAQGYPAQQPYPGQQQVMMQPPAGAGGPPPDYGLPPKQ